MISLNVTPRNANFSANPILVELSTDNTIQQTGLKSRIEIAIKAALSDGKKIPLDYNNIPLVFEVNDILKENGVSIPSGDGSLAHAEAIAALIRANYHIERDFDVSTHIDEITNFRIISLRSKLEGAYQLPGYSSAEVDVTQITPGQAEIKRPNMRIYFELFLEDYLVPGQFNKIYSAPMELDQANVARIDLSESLNSSLEMEDADLQDHTIKVCPLSKRRFYFRYAEAFGSPPAIQQIQKSQEYHVIKGGLNFESQNVNGLSRLLSGTPAGDRFLTHGLAARKIRKDQPCFLSFFLQRPISEVYAQYMIYYTDGSVIQRRSNYLQVSQFQKITIPAGIINARLNVMDPKRQIQWYTVRLYTGFDVPISEPITYIVDQAPVKQSRTFLFVTSLGAWETFVTTGQTSAETELSGETASLVGSEQIRKRMHSFAFGLSAKQMETVSTGRRPSQEIRSLLDFFLSDVKFLVSDGRKRAILVTTKTLPMPGSQDDFLAFDFDYELAFKEKSYAHEGDRFNMAEVSRLFFETGITSPAAIKDGTGAVIAMIPAGGSYQLSIISGGNASTIFDKSQDVNTVYQASEIAARVIVCDAVGRIIATVPAGGSYQINSITGGYAASIPSQIINSNR